MAHPKTLPGASQNSPRSIPKLCQDHPKTLPGASQNSPRIIPKLSQDHPELSQEHPKNCSEVSEKRAFKKTHHYRSLPTLSEPLKSLKTIVFIWFSAVFVIFHMVSLSYYIRGTLKTKPSFFYAPLQRAGGRGGGLRNNKPCALFTNTLPLPSCMVSSGMVACVT